MLETADTHIASGNAALRAAFDRLLSNVEDALGYDELSAVTTAYQDYTDSYLGVLTGSVSADVLGATSNRFVDAVRNAVDRPSAISSLDDATADYLADLADACDRLGGASPDLDALASVAAGTTLLSWLQAALELADQSTGMWGAGPVFTDSPPRDLDDQGGPMSADTDTFADDDGIVWQEFTIGNDGEVVTTTRESSPPTPRDWSPPTATGATAHAERNGDAASQLLGERAAPPRERRTRHTGSSRTSDDPVAAVQSAYQSYLAGLASAGVTVDPTALAGGRRSPSVFELEQQSADTTAAYLRAASGFGSITELYAHYARLLASIAALVEQHVEYTRRLERMTNLGADRSGAADQLYRRFVAATRDAWTRIDPATVTPEQLASLNESIAEAATLHRTIQARAT